MKKSTIGSLFLKVRSWHLQFLYEGNCYTFFTKKNWVSFFDLIRYAVLPKTILNFFHKTKFFAQLKIKILHWFFSSQAFIKKSWTENFIVFRICVFIFVFCIINVFYLLSGIVLIKYVSSANLMVWFLFSCIIQKLGRTFYREVLVAQQNFVT